MHFCPRSYLHLLTSYLYLMKYFFDFLIMQVMLIEHRKRSNGNQRESQLSSMQLKEAAYMYLEHVFDESDLRQQLGYSQYTIDKILPIAVSYYLLGRGRNTLTHTKRRSTTQAIANRYVVLALQVYPGILEEIASDKRENKRINVANPHDVAMYMGERIAGLEVTVGKKADISKIMRKDVETIGGFLRNVRNRPQKASKTA